MYRVVLIFDGYRSPSPGEFVTIGDAAEHADSLIENEQGIGWDITDRAGRVHAIGGEG